MPAVESIYTLPGKAARVSAARERPDVLPDPRLPRSPRVRDRWARMRRPAMRRTWYLDGLNDDTVQARIYAWRDLCYDAYGPGVIDMERQYLSAHGDTLRVTFTPDRNRTSRRA